MFNINWKWNKKADKQELDLELFIPDVIMSLDASGKLREGLKQELIGTKRNFLIKQVEKAIFTKYNVVPLRATSGRDARLIAFEAILNEIVNKLEGKPPKGLPQTN